MFFTKLILLNLQRFYTRNVVEIISFQKQVRSRPQPQNYWSYEPWKMPNKVKKLRYRHLGTILSQIECQEFNNRPSIWKLVINASEYTQKKYTQLGFQVRCEPIFENMQIFQILTYISRTLEQIVPRIGGNCR